MVRLSQKAARRGKAVGLGGRLVEALAAPTTVDKTTAAQAARLALVQAVQQVLASVMDRPAAAQAASAQAAVAAGRLMAAATVARQLATAVRAVRGM
jgi:hypothetical protein